MFSNFLLCSCLYLPLPVEILVVTGYRYLPVLLCSLFTTKNFECFSLTLCRASHSVWALKSAYATFLYLHRAMKSAIVFLNSVFRIRIHFITFVWSNYNYLSLGVHKGRPSCRRSFQPSKENIRHFKTWNFLTFYTIFLWLIFALLDPDS